MGTAGASAGFIFFLFFALLGGIIFLALGIYRRHYLRQKTDPSSLRILLLNSTMTIAITPILLLLTGILVHSIGRFFIEKSQLETDKQRYKSLSSALPFGEIIIPKDSWINSTGTVEYPFENFKDIRQGLYKAGFQHL